MFGFFFPQGIDSLEKCVKLEIDNTFRDKYALDPSLRCKGKLPTF